MKRHTYEDILQETSNLKRSLDADLKYIDHEIGYEYVEWLIRKTSYFYRSVRKLSYPTQPDNLERGDVIWVDFGINIGTELSDYKVHGHFAVCWVVDLGNLVVIPLSSSDANGSALTYDIGVIEGISDDRHSYLKLDAIRSVSKRRVTRIHGTESGKIRLDEERINMIKEAIKIAFIE